MPKFNEVNGKQFLQEYNGVELFKEFTPKIAKLPSLTYKLYYNTPAPEVVEKCIKLGRCTKEEADSLIAAFNERYGDK